VSDEPPSLPVLARHGSSHLSRLTLQRQALIAVNYPARVFGIGRHCTAAEAKKLCPQLISQHVATWREGDDKWYVKSRLT
jgi:nucleotidyltransferase/DNA polymerase involved in DNA repair